MTLPVYTPSTTEAFATYGVLDGGAIVQPVLAPTDVIPQFGGLEVSTSSTTLQALTDAVLYLTDYRYASSDGLASQLLAISSLRDVLDAFDAPELPSAGEIDAAMNGDIAELTAMQNDDGGFPYWLRGRPSEPFNTIQATHALIVARDAGYAVPADAIARGVDALGAIEQFFDPGLRRADEVDAARLRPARPGARRAGRPGRGAGAVRRGRRRAPARRARLALAGDRRRRHRRRDRAAPRQRRRRHRRCGDVHHRLTDDGAAVTLASDRRTDGLILDALIAVRPDSDLIAKVVRGLLAGQGDDGRWDNVQENAFILLALRHYFDAFEGTDPDFVARVWLGERYAGEQEFAGRSTTTNVISIPTADLIAAGDAGRHRRPRGHRTAVLPHRAAHRPGVARPRPARPRVRRRPHVRGRRRPGRRHPRRRRHVAHPGRRPGPGAPDDGRREPAHARRPRRPAARRPGDRQPGAGDVPGGTGDRGRGDRRRSRRDRRGGARGSTTRTCATTAPRPSPATSAPACTTTRTSPRRRRPARSSCRRRAAEEIYAPETFGRAATDRVVVS